MFAIVGIEIERYSKGYPVSMAAAQLLEKIYATSYIETTITEDKENSVSY